MTDHTGGALIFAESEYEPNRFTIGANGKWLMSIQHNGEQTMPQQRENMRRMAACWNACEGIPTEVLQANQAGGLPWRVADQIEARVMRDELLKALQDLVKVCKLALDYGGRTTEYFRARDGHLVKACDDMKSANEAIAKATRNETGEDKCPF